MHKYFHSAPYICLNEAKNASDTIKNSTTLFSLQKFLDLNQIDT